MSEIHGAVGSYVIHALDEVEQDEFEAHLAVCETCRREVHEFSETAVHLSSLVETAPPPALRSSILSAIREVRPLPPEQPAAEQTPDPRPVNIAVADHTEITPAVDELAVRRQRRSTRLLALAVAAAMVVALALGGWVVNLVQTRHAQVADQAAQTQLLTAPDVKIYAATVNGAHVSYAVSKSLDKALFIGKDLPAPGPNRTYQLWTLKDKGATAIPDNLFSGGQNRNAWFTGPIRDADGLAVTIEPKGGSTKPTSPAMAVQAF